MGEGENKNNNLTKMLTLNLFPFLFVVSVNGARRSTIGDLSAMCMLSKAMV